MLRHVLVYFSEKEYQYYEYPTFKASIAIVQIKVIRQIAMHKVVLNLEFRRIDIYTLYFSQNTTCTVYITTVTEQRTDIHKTVTTFSRAHYSGFVDGAVNWIGYFYLFHWQVCTPL